ncbi:hypothetical protein FA95DRAFT_1528972 [Auriscalpium vulgare]|uniref:Uncharacterized protein n=1 Tax=Auriscalpium vulgare TaxID=40419 RepID=A0ACB8R4D6_9AGAM|nr:hypothetical protein FA95DRAFT_1528972 [Auriscalpium vulgare]
MLPNTPFHIATHSRNSYRPTTVAEAEDIIKTELRFHAYKDTDKFLATHFDENEVSSAFVKAVFDALIVKKEYIPASEDARGHWAGLPLNPPDEKGIYRPLTDIFNAITTECALQINVMKAAEVQAMDAAKSPGNNSDVAQPQKPPQMHFDIVWRDEHDHPPVSSNQYAADIRPDIVATFKIAQAVAAPSGERSRVWWRSVHVPLEVKKISNADAAVLQIFRYVRQSLWDQPDRRFMFGLVFARHSLTVWHVDHTGALAALPINIHKDPEQLIRVVVGLVVKTPESLGWDPTMLMHLEDAAGRPMEPLPSYTVDVSKYADAARNLYNMQWVVTLQKPTTAAQSDSQDQGGVKEGYERFVLFKALSLSRGEVIRGRATRVWRAWKWDDMGLRRADRKVYAVKDTWRDARRDVEGELYLTALQTARDHGSTMKGVAQMHSFCVVQINGVEDTTLVAVRRRLVPSGKPLKLETKQIYARLDGSPRDKNVHVFHEADVFEEEWADNIPAPWDRVHSRLVMSTTGWPLLNFHNLPELFGGVHDAIAGHKWLRDQGILHRDISYNNILLTGQDAPNRAVMIDLDNAVVFQTHQTLADDERSVGTLAFMSYEVLRSKHYFSLRSSGDDSDADENVAPAPVVKVRHNFIHDLESYMWVLCWIGLCREGPGKERILKNMSKSERDAWQAALRRNFEHLESDVIANAKHFLISDRDEFHDSVLKLFSPYFMDPLTQPLLKLHRALRKAYKNRDYSDNLYETFSKTFADAAISDMATSWHTRPGHSSFASMEQEVRRSRELDEPTFDLPQPASKTLNKRTHEATTGLTVLESVAEGDDGGVKVGWPRQPQPPQTPEGKRRKGN